MLNGRKRGSEEVLSSSGNNKIYNCMSICKYSFEEIKRIPWFMVVACAVFCGFNPPELLTPPPGATPIMGSWPYGRESENLEIPSLDGFGTHDTVEGRKKLCQKCGKLERMEHLLRYSCDWKYRQSEWDSTKDRLKLLTCVESAIDGQTRQSITTSNLRTTHDGLFAQVCWRNLKPVAIDDWYATVGRNLDKAMKLCKSGHTKG